MENKLIINNESSQLILEDLTIMDMISKSLKFRDPKCFQSSAYQLFIKSHGKKGWDGYKYFFNKDNGKFIIKDGKD